jgi:hypothetical protein
MVRIEANLKSLMKYLFGMYFAMPDPMAGGIHIVDYAKKFHDSKLAQRIKVYNRSHKTVA